MENRAKNRKSKKQVLFPSQNATLVTNIIEIGLNGPGIIRRLIMDRFLWISPYIYLHFPKFPKKHFEVLYLNNEKNSVKSFRFSISRRLKLQKKGKTDFLNLDPPLPP